MLELTGPTFLDHPLLIAQVVWLGPKAQESSKKPFAKPEPATGSLNHTYFYLTTVIVETVVKLDAVQPELEAKKFLA